MSSETMLAKANAINEASRMITKLTNLQDAMRDFDRLRLQGARFEAEDDDSFLEFNADMDGIRQMACGTAGDLIAREMADPTPMQHLCKLGDGENEGDLGDDVLEAIGLGLERALARQQNELQKLLLGD